MTFGDLAWNAGWAKPALTVACLALFWSWESIWPFFAPSRQRLRHGGHNIALAVFNTLVLSLVFGAATVGAAHWAASRHFGLLHQLPLAWPARLLLALLLLDAWLYVWHRLNHHIPLLWRFHRVHHADDAMDVTTATRFHLGELSAAAVLRLGLIPLLGIEVTHLLVHETLVVAATMFHHANISLGRWDAPLRWVIVTPFMHKVHHSHYRPETNSNYSVLFSWWDRLASTFRTRDDYATLKMGLDEFDGDRWQTFLGMLRTPLVNVRPQPPPKATGENGTSDG
jgi:sterol desaturase/sphingolipid hydroxylase (fatty acid hydroxylase superfamily)